MDLHSTKVKEVVTENADGTYTIFLNAWLDPMQKKQAYKHALLHIKNYDFEGEKDINEIETKTHEKTTDQQTDGFFV